jgi:sec-independent protein translocase protein TatC
MPDKLTFWEHLGELRTVVIRIVATVSIASVFFFLFGIREGELFGFEIAYPFPDMVNNIPNHLFLQIKSDLLPTELELFPIKLIHPILTNVQISLFLGIVVSTPMIFVQIGYFVGPALYPKEKRILKWVTIPATSLFIIGCLFSYYLLTPFLIKFMNMYITSMETVPMVSISDFIGFVLMITLAFGIIFELPVIMIGFTKIGIIKAEFWKKHWRMAAIIIAIVGAAITPDGTGITMMIVAIPMWLLYLFGYLGARYVEARKLKIQ